MKIEDLREKKDILKFYDLTVGGVFKKAVPYDDTDRTFMKIPRVIGNDDSCEKDDYNAVCLNDSILSWFDWNEDVIEVEAKIVIVK